MQQFFFSSCSSLFLSQSYSNSSSHSSSSHLFFPFLSRSSELYFLTRCKLIGRKLRSQYFGRTVIYWIQAMATQVLDSRCFGFVFFSFCVCVCVFIAIRAHARSWLRSYTELWTEYWVAGRSFCAVILQNFTAKLAKKMAGKLSEKLAEKLIDHFEQPCFFASQELIALPLRFTFGLAIFSSMSARIL